MSQSRVSEGARKYKEEPGPGAAQKLHHPHPSQQHPSQGLPPPNHHPHQQHHNQHHSRPVASLHQQPHPDSPHQSQPSQSPAQAHYPSPHPSTTHVPQQHQSPYVQQLQGPPGPQQPEVPYYNTHTGPYSNNSAPTGYSAAETSADLMPAGTLSRGPYSQGAIYQPTPPQSNPGAPLQSPQQDQHARHMYGAPQHHMPPQWNYTSPYGQTQTPQSPYPPHPVHQQSPQQPMSASVMMTQQQNQQLQHPHQPHTPGLRGESSPKSRGPQAPVQRPHSNLAGPPQAPPQGPPVGTPNMHSGAPGAPPNMNPNAAPGPIPATTPLVVRQDNNGVQWIAFEYSRDRVKMEYTIRCDVESVNVDTLSDAFKTENCVYPRACCAKENYKGNRLHYETECNTVGWALADLNPSLRGKRGLIQRAVDSWRNSNQDPRLRSRRVRRMAKVATRKTQAHASPMQGPGAPGPVPHSAGLATAHRPPNMGLAGPIHHGQDHHGGPPPNEDVSANNYPAITHHHQAPHGQEPPPNGLRPVQNFYPTFPTSESMAQSNGMPRVDDPSAPRPIANRPEARRAKLEQDEEDRKKHLFGAFGAEASKRKFIVVKDDIKHQGSRVHCALNEVLLQEIPDSFRQANCLFPRSYFPMQMSSPPPSPSGRSRFLDDAPDPEDDPGCPLAGSMLVPVETPDNPKVDVPVPRLTRAARTKDIDLNELGYRMAWGQSRMFAHRHLFLQKALDSYRNLVQSTMTRGNRDVPPHFQMRVGKRKWEERHQRRTHGNPGKDKRSRGGSP